VKKNRRQDIADIEKQITMVINEDVIRGKKKYQKIIINGDDKDTRRCHGHAYSIGEGDARMWK